MTVKTPKMGTAPRGHGVVQTQDRLAGEASAVFLTEALSEINEGAAFLDQLTLEEISAVRRIGSSKTFATGQTVFLQGDRHSGIFLIESGRVRTYYAGPSGREITLAYWTPGHFVGGPEVFGGGFHIWSANAMEASRLSYLPGGAVRQLALSVPSFAICLIEGLAAKGKCYSALAQMLGTRSAAERLAQLLLILASVDSKSVDGRMAVNSRITHEQLASIVGATRQWVTSMLARFQSQGLISIEDRAIIILKANELK
ncbi:MAG TPA: Crp/Fnr family transcriptional regulator [Hyphomicrobiales bacterium]|nr:Crp/Fnr family transcriptional regulator [Hyphomicrobiales bacterium]